MIEKLNNQIPIISSIHVETRIKINEIIDKLNSLEQTEKKEGKECKHLRKDNICLQNNYGVKCEHLNNNPYCPDFEEKPKQEEEKICINYGEIGQCDYINSPFYNNPCPYKLHKQCPQHEFKPKSEPKPEFKVGDNQINDLCIEAHKTAKEHGFYENKKSVGEVIALMHSELSEAFEAYRKGNFDDSEHGFFTELADCTIRIFDFCGANNIDLNYIIKKKMEYNKTRPYKHGKKC